jgi:hypothetical protein
LAFTGGFLMPHYRSAPTFDQDILAPNPNNAKTTASWYRWFQDIDLGVPPSSELPVTVGASPFIYTASLKGGAIVNGGTVTSILISRSGTFYATGLTQGLFTLAANDQLQVVYTGAPTMVFLPS